MRDRYGNDLFYGDFFVVIVPREGEDPNVVGHMGEVDSIWDDRFEDYEGFMWDCDQVVAIAPCQRYRFFK